MLSNLLASEFRKVASGSQRNVCVNYLKRRQLFLVEKTRHITSFGSDLTAVKEELQLNSSIKRINQNEYQDELPKITSVQEFFAAGIDNQRLTCKAYEKLLDTLLHRLKCRDEIISHPSFESFLTSIGGNLKHASASVVTKIAHHLVSLPSTSATRKLAQQCGLFAAARPNAFSPSNFARLIQILSLFQVTDVRFINFVQKEALHLMPEFRPSELYRVLDGIHHLQLSNRHLVDLLIEKMVDQLDSYTIEDVDFTLQVFASMGLVRSFVTQRFASLIFKNLDCLSPSQAARIAVSLARLRFISIKDFESVLKIIVKHVSDVSAHEILFAATLVNIKTLSLLYPLISETLKDCDTETINSSNMLKIALTLYTISFFQIEKFYPALTLLSPPLIALLHEQQGTLIPVLSELITSLKFEHSDVSFTVPSNLTISIKEFELVLQAKWNASSVVSILGKILSLVAAQYGLTFQKAMFSGPYCVQFCNMDYKIIINLATPQDVTNIVLRHRHFKHQGYYPVSVPFWEWRRLCTEEAQITFLKKLLQPVLIEANIIANKIKTAKKHEKRRATITASKLLRQK